MGFLVEYNGGIHAGDYKLVDCGNGNGFTLRSCNCEIINHFEAKAVKGVIELTLEHASMSRHLSLGDADRAVMTAEDAQDLIDTLKEAIEDAETFQCNLRDKNEEKEDKLAAMAKYDTHRDHRYDIDELDTDGLA